MQYIHTCMHTYQHVVHSTQLIADVYIAYLTAYPSHCTTGTFTGRINSGSNNLGNGGRCPGREDVSPLASASAAAASGSTVYGSERLEPGTSRSTTLRESEVLTARSHRACNATKKYIHSTASALKKPYSLCVHALKGKGLLVVRVTSA